MTTTSKEKSRKVRGTAEIFADNRITFRPQAEGEPTQLEKKKIGRSSFYKTTSEKEPQYVAHLSVPADSPDPVAQMQEDLALLTKGMETKTDVQPKGKLLVDNDGLRIYTNNSRKTITVVQEIDLSAHPNYEKFMLNQMQQIFRCFTINETSFRKLTSAPRKCSRK